MRLLTPENSTDFAGLCFASSSSAGLSSGPSGSGAGLVKASMEAKACPIRAIALSAWPEWLKQQNFDTQSDTQYQLWNSWISAQEFGKKPGAFLLCPDVTGALGQVLFLFSPEDVRGFGLLPWRLPKHTHYTLSEIFMGGESTHHKHEDIRRNLYLSWGEGAYCDQRYQSQKEQQPAILHVEDEAGLPATHILHALRGRFIVRDLVNTPANLLHPQQLAQEAQTLAKYHKADFSCIMGKELAKNYPLIDQVGQASVASKERAPRLVKIEWQPRQVDRVEEILHLVIIGKGVSFDTGGLNLKPGHAMAAMKKDMGGAAHALALGDMVMHHNLPVKLTILVPIVENALGNGAFRPGDILTSRTGRTIEIGNTDAEGRLILADALSLGTSLKPDLIMDFATLTGAARVALGPDIPAIFARDHVLTAALQQAGEKLDDPLWPLPLWSPYKRYLKSDIADINNAGESGFAGAITAALFLAEFVPPSQKWVHFDVYAWNAQTRPGRPKGGEAMGIFAAMQFLQDWSQAGGK